LDDETTWKKWFKFTLALLRMGHYNHPFSWAQFLDIDEISKKQTTKQMSNLFFTSDHHFGHSNIIKFCDRPFNDVEEMNEVMIENWNKKIGPNDDVYHLGDFAMTKDRQLVSDILDRLNGNIHLIVGNHEGSALNHQKKFKWIKDYYELKVKDPDCKNGVQRIILFHYAMRVWRSDFRGTWQLYGHSHGSLPDKENKLAFDIGVDCHDFYPLSYEEVKAIMQTKKWSPPFAEERSNI
jgi:calcineurin-like phosphoesterase family protein